MFFFAWLRAEIAAAVRGGFQDALAAPLSSDGPSPPNLLAAADAVSHRLTDATGTEPASNGKRKAVTAR